MAKIFNTRPFRVAGLQLALLVGFLFMAQAKAQTEPITTFPYQTSFGTTASPQADNALWKTQSATQATAAQWEIKENPASPGTLAVAFEGNNQTELYPTIFSPSFFFGNEEGAEYVFTLSVYVPAGGRLPNENHYVLRVNKVDGTGATMSVRDIVNGKGFATANMKNPVMKDGIAQSVFVGSIENGGPQEGNSIHEFRLKAEDLSQAGNYRLSITEGNTASIDTNCKLYIKDFKVEKIANPDVEACQLLSPVSVIEEGVSQQVQCYVRNVGAVAATGIKAFYQVDGGRAVEQAIDGTLAPKETRLHTFNIPVTLTAGVHRIKCWFKDVNDIKPKNDTSLTYVVKVSNTGAFSNFDFLGEEQTYGWHAYSDITERNPLWHFASQSPFYPQAATQGEGTATTHDDYLVSPWFELKKGQIYQVNLSLETVLREGEVLGEKSFSVWLANSNRKEDFVEHKKLIWDAGVLRRKGERTMTFFFEAESDTSACVVFRSNGPTSDGFIRINHFSLQQPRSNEMELFYDFEPHFSSEAISQAKEYMTFVDQDWNALVKVEVEGGDEVEHEVEPTVTSGWEVVRESLGYSAYAKGIQGTANDWLIFYPMELKGGKTYYLHFRTRKQGERVHANDGKCALEVYLQNTYPRYELSYDDQQGAWKKRVEVTGTNATLKEYEITVQEDGHYFLSFRNVTHTAPKIDTPNVYDNSVYLDDVMFASQNFTSVQALEAQIPYEARLGETVDIPLMVKNFSPKVIDKDSVYYCYRIDGHEAVKQKHSSSVGNMAHATYTFRQVDFGEDGDHVVYFWVETRGSKDIPDTVKMKVNRIYPKELPYEDEFTATSLEDWQFYPSSINSWILSTESSAVHSGTHCMSYRPGTHHNISYLVSPLLWVQKDITYRIAFRYKREHAAEKTDSVRLYYAYNRFDRTGFTPMKKAFVADSADYTLCTAYVRFPDDGKAYMAMGVDCAIGSPVLFIDDFSMADSAFAHSTQMILSGLEVPQGMSFCDTTSKGSVEFYVKNSSFLDVENAKVRYEDATFGQKELQLGKIVRHDSIKVSVPVGHRLEGDYAFRAWNVLPYEWDRSDDTISGKFTVSGAKGFPFSEDFEGIVKGTGAVDVNDDGMVWRILKSAQQSRTGSQCLNFPHKNASSDAVFFTDGFIANQTGRFKITFYMKADVEGHDGVGVRVMEYDASGSFVSSVNVGTFYAGTEYEQYNVPFHVESGKMYAIAFEYISNHASTEEGQARFIDDLTTGDITPAVRPNGFAVADTGLTFASFTCQTMADRNVLRVYTADGKYSRLYVWEKTQQKFEVTDLRPKTEYRAQVRGLNEVNDSSAWSAQVRFVTKDTVKPVDPSSIYEGLQAGNHIKVLPNPASERVQVELSLEADRWSLCNAGGKTVLHGTDPSIRFEINLQGLPTGMYFLRVEDKRGMTVTKIIKK